VETGCDQFCYASRPEKKEPLLLPNNEACRLLHPVAPRSQNEAVSVMKNKFDFAFRWELFFGMEGLRVVMP
jgi:hypothetical protein